jgi:hypothetical protein
MLPTDVPDTEIVELFSVPDTVTVASNQYRSVLTAAELRLTVSVAELKLSSLRCVSSTSVRSKSPLASS